jgi:hypothetical protein
MNMRGDKMKDKKAMSILPILNLRDHDCHDFLCFPKCRCIYKTPENVINYIEKEQKGKQYDIER